MPLNIGDNRISDEKIARVSEDDAERLKRYRVQVGDIIYSRRGDVERRSLVREREDGWLCGTGCLRVRVGRAIADPEFTAQYLGHPAVREWIVRHAHGATMPNLNTSILAACPFVLPPLKEQIAIASVLGALDDKIELNRRMNETLEETARAIFKDWFVDFGPTRAKMGGRAPYLSADIWSLFPDRLDDEGKPEGWSVGALSDITSLNPESWSRANYPETVNYVDLSNTKWGTIEVVAHVTADAAPSRAQRILRPGDTIVGTVRPGNGSYAFVSAQGLTGSTGFAVLRPIKEIYREAVYLAATSKENIDRLAHLADGGAYPAVRPELVAGTELIAAPEDLFSAFSFATGGLVDRAEANKRENRTLSDTRDLLLPKLMSGEVRVKDAEKLIGEAT
jgi:type I restriction enzyme S subunit